MAALDRRRFVASLGVFGAGGLAARALAAVPAKISRRQEVELYRRFAEATHPRGREAAADPTWRARASKLAAEAERLSYAAYVTRMYALAAWFKDGHTTFFASDLDRGPFSLKTPFAVRAFYEGLFVIAAKDEAAPLLGGKIVSVGGVSAVDLMRRFDAVWPSNNPAWTHHDADILFASAGFLQGLGVLGEANAGRIPVRATLTDGSRVDVVLEPRPGGDKTLAELVRTKTPPELWAADAKSANYVRYLPEKSAAYVAFDDLNVELLDFTRDVMAAVGRPEVKRLVIDMRRNGGGDSFLAEPLRHELERSRLNVSGDIYMLIGPASFSAAQNVISRMERETFTIFVGEPSGGAPNHYGDGKHFEGAASGLRGQVSTLPWFDSNPTDHRIWTAPDLPAPRLFDDWKAGRDTALKTALDDVAAPVADDSDDRLYYYNRPSQKRPWTPFWLP